MKQRKFKFSLGMKIASILSCIALVSVGFASWWIIKPVEDKTVDGSFTVYSVSEKEVVISEPTFTGNANIIFGKLSGETENDWLYPNGVDDQNLSATFSFDLEVKENGGTKDDIKINSLVQTVTIELVPTDATNMKNAIDAGYIKDFKVTYAGNDYTYSTDTGKIVISIEAKDFNTTKQEFSGITVSFDWGSTFGNTNPYLYYNNLEYAEKIGSQEAHDHAFEHLGKLNTYLGNMSYNVTISATPKSVG